MIRRFSFLTALVLCSCTNGAVDLPLAATPLLAAGTFGYPAPDVIAAPAVAVSLKSGPLLAMQRTVLRNDGALPGENFLSVETRGSSGTRPDLLLPPTIERLRAEMRAAMPGLAMRISATPARSRDGGPLGYATGTARGASCVYAWSWRDGAAGAAGLFARREPVSRRIRLCGNGSPEAMLRLVLEIDRAGAELGVAPTAPEADALDAASQSFGMAPGRYAAPGAVSPASTRHRPGRGATVGPKRSPLRQEAVLRPSPSIPTPSDTGRTDVPASLAPKRATRSIEADRRPAIPLPGDLRAVASESPSDSILPTSRLAERDAKVDPPAR